MLRKQSELQCEAGAQRSPIPSKYQGAKWRRGSYRTGRKETVTNLNLCSDFLENIENINWVVLHSLDLFVEEHCSCWSYLNWTFLAVTPLGGVMNMLACMNLMKTINIEYATIYIPYIVNVKAVQLLCDTEFRMAVTTTANWYIKYTYMTHFHEMHQRRFVHQAFNKRRTCWQLRHMTSQSAELLYWSVTVRKQTEEPTSSTEILQYLELISMSLCFIPHVAAAKICWRVQTIVITTSVVQRRSAEGEFITTGLKFCSSPEIWKHSETQKWISQTYFTVQLWPSVL